MNLIELLKGVWNRMVGPKTIESVLRVTPAISSVMKDAIELWEMLYSDKSPWLSENVKSLGLPAMIASEKARTATIEMEIKITGDNERADFIRTNFNKLLCSIRKELELGIALGGLVIKPYPVMGVDGKYTLEFTFVNATNFYPLAFAANGRVTEAAFIDRIITKEYIYSKVEYHKLVGTTLTVVNKAFKSTANVNNGFLDTDLGTPISLSEQPSWANLQPEVTIENIDCLLFAVFKMPTANNLDLNSPLGISGFSKAVDLIRQADELYSALLWEFEGGQLAVDVDRTALNMLKDGKGNIVETLPKLQERLFRRNLDLGTDDTYNVFNPPLRDASYINGLNNILTHIEDVCEISRGTLSQVEYSEARTATELKILKQRSFAANADIQKALEGALHCTIEVMERYCDLYQIVPQGEFEVAYKWDDSIIVDKDTERQVDLLDVNAGLLSMVEYRMKWMGETEQQAEESLKKIREEQQLKMQMQMTVQNAQTQTDAQASVNKKQRANESLETTE